MAPTPQEYTAQRDVTAGLDGERIVISGMSGLYPQSHHVQEFSNILYNKVNPVTDENCRWQYNHPEVSYHTGKVPGLGKFDAQFFKVHYRLGDTMDSMSRKMLEQAFQAIYDAGISPEHLSGKKVGVYTGSCFSETEKVSFYVSSSRSGFGIAGCSKAMFANRISYWLNAKGPSMSIDNACCSSIAALEQAYLAIARGECEAAIVGGANLCLHPQSSVHYSRIMTICPDGKTKSFDQKADGCAKSEAINVLFLQKAKSAKRVYAEILHIKNIFTSILEGETGPKYGFYRDPINMAKFIKQFYEEAKVSPQEVEYVEAFGSAVPEVDKTELEAFQEVYCKNRTDPLLVGSVMSNIGYGEAASGISAITKVLLGYHNGQLAANLHCENPRRDVAALRDGRMRIVTEHQSFGCTYTAVNGISVTGVNAHVLLHGNYKPKNLNRYKSAIPHLVILSGRQDSAVKRILEDLKSRPVDPEELALLHNIHQTRISGHLGRGYSILATNEDQKTVSLAEQAGYFDDVKRPLWFVYSGMGSQWAGMGAQLMRIPIFATAIEKCRKVLEPKGVDIVHIITSPDKKIFDNILHSFVGIAAVQIGLTDILFALGLVPDMIIGHSVGELGCAYADGCFTAEEMILSAYSRGLVSVQTSFIRGSMAAVGIGYQQIVDMLPPEIEVACHNGPESCTISGPADVMRNFVTKLTAQSIFAKEVPCSNIAYHSRYIAEAGPGLRKYLSEVIKNPKARSERWLSSSVPEEKWNEPAAMYSSAEYHTNNLLNPVLFEETCHHIPENAVLVEIAPHGLLQAILKRSLSAACHNIPLTRRGHPDNALLLLDAVGKLYMDGYYPKVEALYPKVEFPVSTGTPMLSHLVEWAHDEDWTLPLYVSARRKMAASSTFTISIHDDEHNYLQGNIIRGKTLYPFSAALVAVWDTLAMTLGEKRRQVSVEYRDVHLFAQPTLHNQRNLKLSISIHRGTGNFEIMDENRKVATGYISKKHNLKHEKKRLESPEIKEDMTISSEDIYQLMYERDYYYCGNFRSIYQVNQSLTKAQIIWNNNWVTFLDSILQLNALKHAHYTVSQPSQIRRICINVDEHWDNKTVQVDGKTVMTAEIIELHDFARCGGVIMEDVKFHRLPALNEQATEMKALKFIPRFQSNTDTKTTLQIYLQIVAENINKEWIKVSIIVTKDQALIEIDEIKAALADIHGLTVSYKLVPKEKLLEMRNSFFADVDLVLVYGLSSDNNLCQLLYQVLQRNTFLVNGETTDERKQPSALYRVVSTHKVNYAKWELIRWRPTQISADSKLITVRVRPDLALLRETRANLPQKHKLVILSSYPPVSGLKDLVKKWRTDTDRNQIYLIMMSVMENIDPVPELDLAFNVFEKGIWGGEYYVPWQQRVTVERDVALRIEQIGNLKSLKWVEANEPAAGSGIPVTVHYAAINDQDVKRATGIIPTKDDTETETSFGMDFSGTTDSGDRVMGIVRSGAASGRVKARPELLWPVPAHWSLEDAATVPSAYAHAFYCYGIKATLMPGMTVLVHGGTGALGQAAIAIALAYDCNVFTTVSDVRKKRFLMKLFPQLKEDHIGNSRDITFGDMVMKETNGIGCHIIICSVKGELKNTSIKCGTFYCVTLDVVQLKQREKFAFGMSHLNEENQYAPTDFTSIFTNENVGEMRKLQMLMSEGIARGYVRPLSRFTYAPHEVPRAFRLVAASRHRGRAVIRLRKPLEIAQPRVFCSSNLCQLVLCDEDAFGLKLADKLINRGAKKLHLHCHNNTTHLRFKIKSWEKLGVKVEVSFEDLSNTKSVLILINNSNRLGPTEGIYIVTTSSSAKVDNVVSIVSHLDLASRNLCPYLRYFAVVNAGNTIGEETCLSRVRDGLPATMINLSELAKVGNTDEFKEVLSWRGAVNAVELGLRSFQGALLVYPRTLPPQNLLQQIAALAEISISEETAKGITLLDLGIELAKVPAVCAYLQDIHNVSLPEEHIPYLTVQQIYELEEILSGTERKEIRGLETLFSYVDPDELLATTEIVFLSTLTSSTNMGDDEIDVSQTYLCVVPGLEGHHGRFRELCERLKLPAIVLQPGLDHRQETLRDTADRYVKILLKYSMKKNFYLVGYESGVLVALEMAAILENMGLVGTVFCIGGIPEDVIFIIEEQLHHLDTEEALQDAVARHMFALMVENTKGLDQALQKVSTWREKVETCVRMLLGRVAHSAQYARTLIEAAYMRIKQTRDYKPQPRQLQSRIVILYPSRGTSTRASAEVYQRYSKQPVMVEELRLSLAYATRDLRCATIINKYLGEEILAAFEEKNLCDSYVLNSYTFALRPDDGSSVV